MKKIVLIASVIVAAIVVLTINVSLNSNSQTGNIDLTNLKVTNEASAECYPPDIYAGGHCLILSELCVFAAEYTECDPYRN